MLSDQNECEGVNPCSHICKDLKVGYECVCRPGFKPHPSNPHLCTDVDECSEYICSQKCRNTFGSFSCGCADGYLLLPDQRSCKANSSKSEQQLLFFHAARTSISDMNEVSPSVKMLKYSRRSYGVL